MYTAEPTIQKYNVWARMQLQQFNTYVLQTRLDYIILDIVPTLCSVILSVSHELSRRQTLETCSQNTLQSIYIYSLRMLYIIHRFIPMSDEIGKDAATTIILLL